MNRPFVKILQINSQTWMWILFNTEGKEILFSSECKTYEECQKNFDEVFNMFSLMPSVYKIPIKGNDDSEFPEFVKHY
jgi:hypothetical protein